jgi:hopene-associated glycosyltransferase HpnB
VDWVLVAGALTLAIWLYLVFANGGFWRADQRLPAPPPLIPDAPEVVAVVPARDEADVVGRAVASLLAQTYQPPLRVVLVDDGSTDGTADAARTAAMGVGAADRLTVLTGAPRPPGWTGKLWAVSQGVAHAESLDPAPAWLLLTDADIGHEPAHVQALVGKALHDHLDLVSVMVKLHCRSVVERLLIPPFVYFFQKLYPFPLVNDPASRTAGAAGGCMLVERHALEAAGGIAAIRGELIDDCALGRLIKANGPIWLGLAERTESLRPYDGFGDIWSMVARSAYKQLRHNPLLLVGTVFGMAMTYIAPYACVFAWTLGASAVAGLLGAAATALMFMSYLPTLRLYGLSPLWAPTLPIAGALYGAMTFGSAWNHWRGRGGAWKGRVQGGITA